MGDIIQLKIMTDKQFNDMWNKAVDQGVQAATREFIHQISEIRKTSIEAIKDIVVETEFDISIEHDLDPAIELPRSRDVAYRLPAYCFKILFRPRHNITVKREY
jgi:hypothetical protein